MKVVIKEREFEYISDYPDGWKFSAGDPFKFPVVIGNYPCFIKRFEKKNPEDISGWGLLQKIKGKYEKKLSRIYDILNVQEKGKDIYYVFYEYLEGCTLDKAVIQNSEINLQKLADDLFTAIESLQNNGFWFADFCEKNIFCEKSGAFLLVDLDSTYPVSESPENSMYGNKDYWIVAIQFYREILQNKEIKLSDINGISFNFLQIPFLILHLKLYFHGNTKDYNSNDLFKAIPAGLHVIAPQLKQVFVTLAQNRNQLLSEDDIAKIKNITRQIIINNTGRVIPAEYPVINQFSASKNTVKNKEDFTLSWDVANADKIELHKNGAVFKQINSTEKSMTIAEFFDGTKKENSYLLSAYNGSAEVKSKPIIIRQKEENKNPFSLKVPAIILGLLILAAGLYLGIPYFIPKNYKIYVKEQQLDEDSIITIYGKDLPDINIVHVFFNNTESAEKLYSNDSLVIRVPDIQDISAGNPVTATVSVKSSNKELYSHEFLYAKKVFINNIKPLVLYEDDAATFFGKNLNNDNVKVLFNDKEGGVIRRSNNYLIVKVPKPEDTVSGQTVKVSVNNQSSAVFTRLYNIRYDSIDLINIAQDAKWVAGNLLPDGNNITNEKLLLWRGDSTDVNGYARTDFITMEDGKNYVSLRTHPKWESKGTIKGYLPWKHLKGKKIFKAQIGFVQGGNSFDGVAFQVWVHYRSNTGEKWENIINRPKRYDNRLTDISAEFPKYTTDDFSIELRVDAGETSVSDWAAWIAPKVIVRKLQPQISLSNTIPNIKFTTVNE